LPPLLLSGAADATIRAWRGAEQVCAPYDEQQGGHADSVFCVRPLGLGSRGLGLVASGGWDGELLVSQLEHGGEGSKPGAVRLRRVSRAAGAGGCPAHSDALWRLAECGGPPGGRTTLVSGGWDGQLLSWDLGALDAGGAPQLAGSVRLPWAAGVGAGACPVVDLAASPFGDELVSLGRDGSVRAWDPRCAALDAVLDPAWGRLGGRGGGNRGGGGGGPRGGGWECTRIACVGSTASPARYFVTGHESGQVLLWDRRRAPTSASSAAAAEPLCELSVTAAGSDEGAGCAGEPGAPGCCAEPAARRPQLRRVGCGDRDNVAVVSLCFSPAAPWQLISGHFNGDVRQYDWSSYA